MVSPGFEARADAYTMYLVPLIQGQVPFANIHDELVSAFLAVAGELR